MAKIGIVYYSMYGPTYALAQRIAEGVERAGSEAHLRKVAELLPQEVIEQQPPVQANIQAQSDVTEASVEELPDFDGIVFGSGTRYGNMTAQLKNFIDQTGPLWQEGRLIGKAAGFFTGTSTIHGGQESTILTMSTFAFHMGMVIVPAGYAFSEVMSTRTGGGPYGPSHFSPQDGSKQSLSDDEVAIGTAYGEKFAQIAAKLAA